MRDFTIEGANLLAPINVEGKTLRILKLIEKTFDVIQQVRVGRRTIGFTAISKIIHMSIPKFFVMCDEKKSGKPTDVKVMQLDTETSCLE
jgi:hypothetical protein